MTLDRYSRLRETDVFRDNGHEDWRKAGLAVVGAGALGCRAASEAARSGAGRVEIIDFQKGSVENLGTQQVEVGQPKAITVAQACNEIRPGSAQGFHTDIRHLGVGRFNALDLLMDCTDDARLAYFLSEVSNGLGVPLIRVAVDGSGEGEVGRILCAGGGPDHACQICSYDLHDLMRSLPRISCPDEQLEGPAPTLAGGALSMMVAGLGLLQAQRLVTGHEIDLALDQEIFLDCRGFQIQSYGLRRSPSCLTGHMAWELTKLPRKASETTVNDLFASAREILGSGNVTLEAFSHALNVEAYCGCGHRDGRVAGTDWAPPPACPRCGKVMAWQREHRINLWNESMASDLGIMDTLLTTLGLPADGAMITARTDGKPLLRLLLEQEEGAEER